MYFGGRFTRELFDFFNELSPDFSRQLRAPAVDVTEKYEGELVSSFDLALEKALMQFIRDRDPSAVIVSEETAHVWPPESDRFWVIDPLDGTHNFLMGLPMFGTMLAYCDRGDVVFGAVFLPAQRMFGRSGLYFATRGYGAWGVDPFLDLFPLYVSQKKKLVKALLFVEGSSRAFLKSPAVMRIVDAVPRWRANLSSCWSLVGVAGGKNMPAGADLLMTVGNKPWDNLPACLFIEEAGGRVTDFEGKRWSLENFSTLVFSNGFLHDAVLNLLHET